MSCIKMLNLFIIVGTLLGTLIDDGLAQLEKNDISEPESISAFLQRSIKEDGSVDLGHLLRVSDPMPIPDFNITASDGLMDMDGQFRDMHLTGLADLKITKMTLNLGQSILEITMQTDSLRLEGNYSMEGSVTFLSIDSEGAFWMSGDSLVSDGSLSLKRSGPGGKLETNEIQLNVQVTGIRVHFENLLGGGSWGSLSNSLLNQLNDLIFDQVRTALISDLKVTLRKDLNSRLADFPDELFFHNSTAIFDDLLLSVGEYLVDSGFDPLPLPDFHETFKRKVYFLDVRGQVEVKNGTLYGLSTIRRTADIMVVFENNSLALDARMGFGNLTSSLEWSAHFMDIGPSGKLAQTITKTSVFAKVLANNLRGKKPNFDLMDFQLEKIGQVWTDIQGLGSMDFLMEIVVNLITNSLKHQLAASMIGPVRQAIRAQLDTLPNQFI